MSGRSHSPAIGQASRRQIVRQIHWRSVPVHRDWIDAHRAARIDARCAVAREAHVRQIQARGRRCG